MTVNYTRKILFINSTLGTCILRVQKKEGKKIIFLRTKQ